jgi:hypothetical protein
VDNLEATFVKDEWTRFLALKGIDLNCTYYDKQIPLIAYFHRKCDFRANILKNIENNIIFWDNGDAYENIRERISGFMKRSACARNFEGGMRKLRDSIYDKAIESFKAVINDDDDSKEARDLKVDACLNMIFAKEFKQYFASPEQVVNENTFFDSFDENKFGKLEEIYIERNAWLADNEYYKQAYTYGTSTDLLSSFDRVAQRVENKVLFASRNIKRLRNDLIANLTNAESAIKDELKNSMDRITYQLKLDRIIETTKQLTFRVSECAAEIETLNMTDEIKEIIAKTKWVVIGGLYNFILILNCQLEEHRNPYQLLQYIMQYFAQIIEEKSIENSETLLKELRVCADPVFNALYTAVTTVRNKKGQLERNYDVTSKVNPELVALLKKYETVLYPNDGEYPVSGKPENYKNYGGAKIFNIGGDKEKFIEGSRTCDRPSKARYGRWWKFGVALFVVAIVLFIVAGTTYGAAQIKLAISASSVIPVAVILLISCVPAVAYDNYRETQQLRYCHKQMFEAYSSRGLRHRLVSQYESTMLGAVLELMPIYVYSRWVKASWNEYIIKCSAVMRPLFLVRRVMLSVCIMLAILFLNINYSGLRVYNVAYFWAPMVAILIIHRFWARDKKDKIKWRMNKELNMDFAVGLNEYEFIKSEVVNYEKGLSQYVKISNYIVYGVLMFTTIIWMGIYF